ncbi:hypothetical protein GCM10008083_25450 [Ulvibacter litoralis]|nr:hypothetical protein GCM10008083_25450 [Ulvibacter litoralis]
MVAVLLVIQRSISFQKQDAFLINKSGKQRTLSQSIAKIVFSLDNELDETAKLNSLRKITDDFENTHNFLVANNSEVTNSKNIDSLLSISETYLKKIIASSRNISNNPNSENFKNDLKTIAEVEPAFLAATDDLVNAYQKQLEIKLQNLNLTIYLLAILSVLLLIGEYFFIIAPSFRQLIKRNRELTKVNEDLSISENKLSLSQMALNRAHTELKSILNTEIVAIVSTDNKGIINHFNSGAELLIGYSASEMIGKKEPEIFHIEEELDKFRVDIAERYGLDAEGFDPYLELAKRGEYDTREWTFRRKDGSTFPVQLTLAAVKNEEGEKLGFLGVSFDITERKKAKDELLKKNQLLNFAEEITLMGHWQWDTVVDKVQWSNNLYNIFELDSETIDLNFNTYFEYVHEDDKDLVTEYFENAINGKGFTNFTHRISTNGKIKTIQLLGEVITNDKGNVIELIGTCQDITQQRMAENKFKGLLESAPDAMIIINEKGKIQLINKQAEQLFGYSASELVEESVEILIPKRFILDYELYRDNHFGSLNVREAGIEKELFAKNKEGKEIPIQMSMSPLQTEEGLLVSAAIRDITVQKQAENELLRKNQLLNLSEKITLTGNWHSNIAENTVKWSTNFYHILGVSEDTEVTFGTYLEFVHPEDKERVHLHYQETHKSKNFTDLIHRLKLLDGTVKIVKLRAEINVDTFGNVTDVIGTCQDITQQQMAADKFRGLLESAPDAMVIVNERGKIQLINKQAEKLFGYSAIELLDKSVEVLIPERFANGHGVYRDHFFANPKVRGMGVGKDLYGKHKDGKEIPIQISLSPIETEEGLLVSAAIRDITLQKIAENELLQKNQLLSFAERIAMMGNWKWNLITNELTWSTNLYDIFEVEESTDVMFDTYFNFIHEEDREMVSESIQESLNGLLFNKVVHRIKLHSGIIKTIQLLAVVSPDSNGQITEIIGTCQDITDQRLAETELLRKNKLLTFAEEITMMGNWQWDLVTNGVKWSANLYRIFGVDKDTDLTYTTYFNFVHPDDKDFVAKHVEKSLEAKKFEDLLHRIKLEDGTVKTIQLLAEIITNDKGELIEIIGTCQDVTQQKMAENKFRGLLESAPDAMVIVNGKGHIQLINKQAEKLFGYTVEELFGKPVETLIPERFTGNRKHKGHRDSFFATPKVQAYGVGDGKELFGINKEGKEIPIQISLSPLETEEGLLVSAAIRDITEQKLAQNKILQAKENLEVLTKHLTDQNIQLEDFAHITSHNLRSPVSNLNALLHLYDIAESEEERKILFEKFEIVIEHLTSTLNTLIEALKTKKEGNKSIELIDFEEVLDKTKEIISGQIINTNSKIISDFSKIPKIKYHKTYLESIFLNLVTNAIKYKSPDRDPELFIETETSNGKIKITFRDNGLGIDLEKHGHKLFGLNKTFHRHPEAKGVGLYLTKIQVESMGGSIYATSEVNKGSVFTIIF